MHAYVNSSSVRVAVLNEHVANAFTYDNKHKLQCVLHDRHEKFQITQDTSGEVSCVLGITKRCPIFRGRTRKTAVSHCSAESEMMSLESGLRLEGVPALQWWGIVIKKNVRIPLLRETPRAQVASVTLLGHATDNVPSNIPDSSYSHPDVTFSRINAAVIDIIIKGCSPQVETSISNPQQCSLD